MKTSIHHSLNRLRLPLILFFAFAATSTFAQDKEHGFNIGLVYPLSIQGIHSTEYTNNFSVHAILGISKAERSFTAAGFGNIIREDASGFQAAGFMNWIGGSAQGFKAAGFMNLYGNADGFQAAGFANFADGNVRGFQAAGFMNLADHIRGFQAAGFFNGAKDVSGTQAAGFINIAENVKGNQLAGFVNIAQKVEGVQIAGFLNIADSSEYPIGIINIVGNGEQFLGVSTDENQNAMLTFRSGSKKLYGILGLGYNFRNEEENIAIQYGLGAHFFSSSFFRMKVEGTVTQLEDFEKHDFLKTSVVAMPAIRFANKVEVFAGPSLNYITTNSDDGRSLVENYLWEHFSKREDRQRGIYIGFTAGLHIAL